MRSALLMLALCLPAWAAGPLPAARAAPKGGVVVPEEVKVKPGRLARIEAAAEGGKAVRWVNVHDDLDLIESETGRWAIVSSPKAGKYKLACYSDAGGPPAYVVVLVGDAPGPKPPGPTPPPVPDALSRALAEAYAKDSDPDGRLKAALASVFREAARPAALDAASTWQHLLRAVSAAALATVGPPASALPELRKAVQAQLKSRLPSADAPLDAPARKLAADVFGGLALALEGISQ